MTWTEESPDVELDDRCIAELVMHALGNLHSMQGRFVRLKATLGDDGYISLDVTRISFTEQDATVRVLLHLTTPVTVTSAPLPQIRPGPSAA